jgi:cyclophilin family peptidyl-prolyl cis-trans isomerase
MHKVAKSINLFFLCAITYSLRDKPKFAFISLRLHDFLEKVFARQSLNTLILYFEFSFLMRFMIFFIGALLLASCSLTKFKTGWTKQKAPAQFHAHFETTEGNFIIEAHREWSPAGVDRLYQLIKRGYFTDVPIYRVVPGFVAQFGLLDSVKTAPWNNVKLPDEPVITGNTSGTLAFARGGKNTCSTQSYINLANNAKLDTSGQTNGVPGFPVLAKVTSGMDVVLKFFAYEDAPRRNLPKGKDAIPFFREKYPEMDYIRKAVLVKGGKG